MEKINVNRSIAMVSVICIIFTICSCSVDNGFRYCDIQYRKDSSISIITRNSEGKKVLEIETLYNINLAFRKIDRENIIRELAEMSTGKDSRLVRPLSICPHRVSKGVIQIDCSFSGDWIPIMDVGDEKIASMVLKRMSNSSLKISEYNKEVSLYPQSNYATKEENIINGAITVFCLFTLLVYILFKKVRSEIEYSKCLPLGEAYKKRRFNVFVTEQNGVFMLQYSYSYFGNHTVVHSNHQTIEDAAHEINNIEDRIKSWTTKN